jgi:N-acetylmuramoyl-L-alanine amidase
MLADQDTSGQYRFASTHYVVDDQEVVQCIPNNEMAYHVGAYQYMDGIQEKLGSYPNAYLLGIEMCHPDWTGVFNEGTVEQTICLCAYLCDLFDLDPRTDIYRHFDITGKECPKWFAQDEGAFEDFKESVYNVIEGLEAFDE